MVRPPAAHPVTVFAENDARSVALLLRRPVLDADLPRYDNVNELNV
jgi:hypothetical protein